MSTSYVDYSVFTTGKFDPRQYANSLLLSTTDRDELLIDFSSAENKIKFDLEEVETVVRHEIEGNWEDLLDRTELAASSTEDIASIDRELKAAYTAYEAMATKALTPYEEAEPLYQALVNLASTTSLLRALKRYLACLSVLDAAKDLSSRSQALLDLERITRENGALMQLRIVLSNLPKVDSSKAQLIRDCGAAIAQYRGLGPALAALQRVDHGQMMNCLRKTINAAIDAASKEFKNGLEITSSVRKLQVSDNTGASATFVHNLQRTFEALGEIANQLQKIEDECPPDMLQTILEELCDASASIKQYFWREMSGRISTHTRDAVRANQWVFRTLRAANIESIVSRGVQKGTMEFSVVHGSLSRR